MATVVEGDQKAPFSIATTPRCRGGCYSFPGITPIYPWYVPYIVEGWAMRYQVPLLKSLVWRDLRLNPSLPDHWRTLYTLGQWVIRNFYNRDFFVLKLWILIGLYDESENVCTPFFSGGLTSSLVFQNIIIWLRNDSNRANALRVKKNKTNDVKHRLISWQLVEI